MKLDFEWTCYIVDGGIDAVREHVESSIRDIVEEVAPLSCIDNNIEGWVDTIMEKFKKCFEEVRQSNIDMRATADSQLEALKNEKDFEIGRVQEELETMEETKDNTISDLENRLHEIEAYVGISP